MVLLWGHWAQAPLIIHSQCFLISSPLRLTTRCTVTGSLSHGGGSSEVGEEFEAEAHHKVPDVSGHLGSGDEDAPDEHHQNGVEGVADVPQPGKQTDTHNWDKSYNQKKKKKEDSHFRFARVEVWSVREKYSEHTLYPK